MHCLMCDAPLTLPLIWRGRTYSMCDKDGIPERHVCPEPEMLAANERWWAAVLEEKEKSLAPVAEKKEALLGIAEVDTDA